MPPYARALALAAAATVLAAPAQASNSAARGFGHGQDASQEPHGQARKALRSELGRFGLVTTDPRTGTPRAVGRLDGFLTGANAGDAADVALGYLRAYGNALGLPDGVPPGLALVARSSTGGIQRLEWRQSYRGIPSSDTGLRAAVTVSGRLLSLGGAPAPDPSVPTTDPKVPAQKAYATIAGQPARVTARGGGAEQATTFAGGGRASLVLYQGADGTRLGWRVLAPVSGVELADAIVDAADGTVARRGNRVKAVTGRVFAHEPADGFEDVPFDPWLKPPATTLNGPWAHAFVDPDDVVDAGALTVPADHEITDWQSEDIGSPEQATTQLFYFVNTFQMHLAAGPISFTTQNFKDADAVLAQAHDGGVGANANFTTLPDGQPGLMAVGVWPGGDGSNDPSIVFHEYTHGMTGRLVTDAQGYGATDTAQAAAIDEGTSDFYALDELDQTVMGAYVEAGGIRTQDIDGTHTYADFGHVAAGPEPHADGEIWAQTLWSIRGALGVEAARRVITQALRIVPPQPSFLDMRNAILQAADDDEDALLWPVFADRWMGYFASTDGSDDIEPVADNTDPFDHTATAVLHGTVRDEDGAPLPGAHVGVAGQDTDGLGPVLADDTDSAGQYAITGLTVAGKSHPLVIASKPAYTEGRAADVAFPATRDFTLARDFASATGGASVASFSGPDHTAEGCGPGGLIDDSGATPWGSSSAGAQSIVIDLGAQVDIKDVAIDPSAGCGDDDTAALGGYQVLTAASPGAFNTLGGGTFTPLHLGALQTLAASARQNVRYVQLRALSPQSRAAGSSGEDFLDVGELQVRRQPGSPVGPAVDTGTASAIASNSATVTGFVKPNGAPPAVVFEYGPSTSYGGAVAANAGSGMVGAVLSGLTPLTEYHYRIVAVRDGRRSEGADRTFVTPAAGVVVPPPSGGVQKLLTLKSRKLTATRAGRFSVRIGFAINAPAGTATVTVARKGKTIAKGRLKSVAGKTRTLKLKLNARGRKAIRRGATKRVRVTAKLPGSAAAKKTLKLSRRR